MMHPQIIAYLQQMAGMRSEGFVMTGDEALCYRSINRWVASTMDKWALENTGPDDTSEQEEFFNRSLGEDEDDDTPDTSV